MATIDARTRLTHARRIGSGTLVLLAVCLVNLGCDSSDSSESPAGASSSAQAGAGLSSSGDASSGFSGTFHATIEGQQSDLTLTQSGTSLNGTADAYKISGTVDGQNATFNLIDPSSGAVGATGTIQRQGQQLVLVLTVTHPQTGQTVQTPPVVYSASGSSVARTQADVPAPSIGGPIDPRIVGRWRHTWARSDPMSGLSIAVDDWLILNADGTCQHGSSRAAGGTGDISLDTGPTALSRGVWRAENKTLLIGDGNGDWSNMGTYMCDETRLLLKSGGSTIYERQ